MMRTCHYTGMKGEVVIIARNSRGLAIEMRKQNLIVDTARETVAEWAGFGTRGILTTLKLSTGGHAAGDTQTYTPPVASDTDLEVLADVFSKALGAPAYGLGGTDLKRLVYTVSIALGEGNALVGDKIYTEAGLFNADGIMFSRVTFAGVRKNSGITLTVTWQLRF